MSGSQPASCAELQTLSLAIGALPPDKLAIHKAQLWASMEVTPGCQNQLPAPSCADAKAAQEDIKKSLPLLQQTIPNYAGSDLDLHLQAAQKKLASRCGPEMATWLLIGGVAFGLFFLTQRGQ